MQPHPAPIRPEMVQPLATRAQLERASEPWALTRVFAIVATLILAMALGSWIGNGQTYYIGILAGLIGAGTLVIAAGDYWWSLPLVLTSLYVGTNIFGVPLSGMEIGFALIIVIFCIKMAMKTLRKSTPETFPEFPYWLLFSFLAVHCAVIIGYSHLNEIPLKNICKSYYGVLAPMVLYGILIRYCKIRTLRPVVRTVFFASVFMMLIAIVVLHEGWSIDPLSDIHIFFSAFNQDGAIGLLRTSGPLLFVGALAFWPTAKQPSARLWLAVAIVVAFAGTLMGGSRMSALLCIIAGIVFAAIRGKLWLAVPFVVFAGLISAIISSSPDLYASLPPLVQRSLAPLNFSTSADDMNDSLVGSNNWHKDLRDRSLAYWLSDTGSFWLGHGFKSWDASLSVEEDSTGSQDIERRAELAVEMGLTENMFNAITNIFGLTGLLLYGLFFFNLAWLSYKGYKLAPAGSDARALCEFSLVNLIPALVFSFTMGYLPTINLIYWQLGYLAARPYLSGKKDTAEEPEAAPEIPAFARPAFAEQRSIMRPSISKF